MTPTPPQTVSFRPPPQSAPADGPVSPTPPSAIKCPKRAKSRVAIKDLSAPAKRPGAAARRRYQSRVVARKPRRSGRFRRLGRATGSGRALANQPLRPRDRSGVCLRHGLRPARLRGLPQAAGSASRLRSRAACRNSTFWARPAPASRPRSGSSALRSGASALAFPGSHAPARGGPGQPAGAYPAAVALRSPPDAACPKPCAAISGGSRSQQTYLQAHQAPPSPSLTAGTQGGAPRPLNAPQSRTR